MVALATEWDRVRRAVVGRVGNDTDQVPSAASLRRAPRPRKQNGRREVARLEAYRYEQEALEAAGLREDAMSQEKVELVRGADRVTPPSLSDGDVAARARAWRNALHASVCDVVEPWAHGTVVRATSRPTYWDFNVVRVEEDPAMSVEELAAFADQALAGLAHRRVDFDLIDAAEPLRHGFEAKDWKATRLLWMRHEASVPPGPEVAVEEVPYDAAHDLRLAWHQEDFPDQDPGDYPAHARDISLRRGARVLVVREDREPVAFAQLEGDRAAAEITHVYVHPEYRGAGRGTALTRAAVEAAGDPQDLWITADAEDRPKELYARLGFRPAWMTMEFVRPP